MGLHLPKVLDFFPEEECFFGVFEPELSTYFLLSGVESALFDTW